MQKVSECNFKKVLVANRGEIAIRVFRACYDLGLHTVAMYSNEDTYALFRTKADEAYLIGENKSPLGAYLDIPAILDLARRRGVDAIHPGYGFLSENADFARACEAAGINFVGPPSHILAQMGDKLAAKATAIACNVPTIPGSTEPLKDADDAVARAVSYGFPIILKAAAGGGGRGMRRCDNEEEVRLQFQLVKNEAKKAFGNEDIFIEKFLVEPKHIEVQILADKHGNVYHLGERDCSLQRRYQKVVEFAPAWSVPKDTIERLRADAVKIARHVGYINAGTVEFLVDRNGSHYFIEMNPRIQVEHTVTEMVTGIDLVRAQILIAEGLPMSDPRIGLTCQEDLHINGYAIQCRVTTEDPRNNFAPDTGKITAYRSGGGFGVRLDGGNAYAGAVVSPYYDSLLVKVTAWDNTFQGACRRATRAISEEHVRGVKTNIPFVTNILTHPTFHAGKCHTKFIDDTPELFDIDTGRDRATKVLKYIAEIQVQNPSAERRQLDVPRFPPYENTPPKCTGLKQVLDQGGPEAVKQWVLDQKKLLVTDTTMRDAHQSLLSTRMRTRDLVKGAEGTAEILNDCFSLEMWGGATFDVAYRFLHESPWERLDLLRAKIPNIPFQMLLRGANAVGYTNYPDNLIREFVKESAVSGIDVFRVFDSLNWLPGMEVAMDEVLKQNKLLEATICYTGDVLDPKRDKYTLDYYVRMAKELEKRGAHLLCIKDMSGLLKPYAAKKLVTALKQEVGLPIHLHTHDTSGNQVAALLMAAEAGVDIVDAAIDSMASMTSQPSLNAVVTALKGQDRDTGLDPDKLQKLSDYWADVRLRYAAFEAGIKNPSTDIYRYEMPGGQYTNLKSQVESLGLGHQFEDVKEMYKAVNDMLGDIVKVTPSSKMVGDLAIFMVQNGLTPDNIVEKGAALTFPDSVVSYFKGMMGQPAWGFPEDLQKVVLKGEAPITCRPGELLPPVDFEAVEKKMRAFMGDDRINRRAMVSYCLYPKVYEEYRKHRKEYGYIMRMGSHVFFNGMALGETNKINIEDGKTLVIKYLGLGDLNEDGTRNVQFELNGMRREIAVPDPHADVQTHTVALADPEDKSQVGASIPGMVSKVSVQPGDAVEENQVIAVIEAMKMETSVVARMAGVIDQVLVREGSSVKAGELLMTIKVK
ncbi:MAG: pyruvate carboxylase [Clostridiales bacterium]|uniref:Pyruvate carboxylase n=2 Tax=Eubacteriales TaxID=186802 RepID=A0AAW5JN44_9FIRM|nr:pyruvate carboxylase [Intestinimonas massiliensis (ex Afouda et al. 2020)]MCG4525786.1 pyruvate carboxylase [Intestinimonas massiliensis (ex Afouda et al. 2020)]MCQ4769274.1 pyruvate carboxylase [Intestinimonas massiliensis (ex Afouda et al. 2020)]MCQ4805842.1 pyruvate carboxylase [Intestinimonas massiliensis (ex Afouda et al. 2020)]MDU1323875.1 pyruvate carboxylase [Clostridiales bacterium]